MGTIKVCDFPGCGDVVEGMGDHLRMDFDMLALRQLAEVRLDREKIDLIDSDPEPLKKDLCRKHSRELRNTLEAIFSGDLVT